MKKVTFISNMKTTLLVLTGLLSVTLASAGPGPQWTWAAGAQTNNGAIVLKSTNGSTTYSGTQNPTGAVAKVNQTAATQPPTVIVQATASLPIKAVGDPCGQTTTGTVPNQTADEGTAVTADRSLLLTCQSGSWKMSGINRFTEANWLAAYSGASCGAACYTVQPDGTLYSGATYVCDLKPAGFCTSGIYRFWISHYGIGYVHWSSGTTGHIGWVN